MAAEGEWTEYLRTATRVSRAVECLDAVGGLDDPPNAPALSGPDAHLEDPHIRNMAMRFHAAHVAKRVASAKREMAADDRSIDASPLKGSLGKRLGYLPRQLEEYELDHGLTSVGSNDDDDDARVVALTRHMRQLPKLELHAHLNGCVRDSTLLDRAKTRAAEQAAERAREEEEDLAPSGAPEETTENDRTGANKKPEPRPQQVSNPKTKHQGGAPAPPTGFSMDDVRAMLKKPDGQIARPLQRCFDLFGAIHDLCTDHDSLRRIAAEAVMDFARDGVVYLELRTTPKDLPARGVTKGSYCAAALDGLALGKKLADDWAVKYAESSRAVPGSNPLSPIAKTESFAAISARLILSIDRRETPAEAVKTVKLAAYLRDCGCDVCGVDLSGNPGIGEWSSFEPALLLARHLKLPVTLHCGEVDGTGAEEAAMIAFGPERFGHCVKTVRSPERWRALRSSDTPVELCVSSNVLTDSIDGDVSGSGRTSSGWVQRARRHHLGLMHAVGHPIAICTDDPGVFETTLSREYALVAVAFDLSDDDVRELVTASVRQAFITDAHDDAFAHEGLRLKRRVMRGVANWRGFPGGTRCSAKSADGIASQLMRRIARLGNVLSESLSRSASPTPKDGVKYAADDDDDEVDPFEYERTAFGFAAAALVGGSAACLGLRLCRARV